MPLGWGGVPPKLFFKRFFLKRKKNGGKNFSLKNPLSLARLSIEIVLLGCLSIGALYVAASATLAPRDPERGVAVVFAPWTAPEAALTRTVAAGARFVRFGGPTFIAIAIPDDRDYASRAFAAGAWLVVDPQVLAACLTPFESAGANQ